MTVVKGMSRGRSTGGGGSAGGGGGGRRSGDGGLNQGGGGDGEWKRGNAPPRRQSSKTMSGGGGGGGGGDWVRGQAMPPQKQQQQQGNNNPRNSRGGRGGRGGGPQPLYDGPVAPLVKTENHWRPKKNSTPLIVAEKLVKAILNKMTKEKFERLAQQMIEIEILSYEMLTMMIENVYDKAIDEPSFGDIYADLCVKLSETASSFVHIIESDEEPPTESGESATGAGGDGRSSAGGGGSGNEASHNTVYRWSGDVSTTDAEVVGPFSSEEKCREVALGEHTDDSISSPIQREEMVLELVSLSIRKNMFIKIMKKKNPVSDDGTKIYYTVFFPVSEAEECGQQLSGIYLSEVEAKNDSKKKNSFKRSLLNKCEEEFNKQDIYKDWKEEKAAYDQTKSTLSEQTRAEKESEFEFRRIRIKKQMLGNVKFIGQLFKKNLLREKIMRYCIASLLKLEELPIKSKNPEYKDIGNMDMDEEDHEAICSMFATTGSTIDKPTAAKFMGVCFGKIGDLSINKSLPARSRFMYKDLIDLRKNQWIPRRKEEKAKTIDEIRKDFEQEERNQAEQSQRENARGSMNQSFRGGGGGGPRNDYRQQPPPRGGGGGGLRDSRSRPSKVTETDEDGFTTISTGKGGFGGGGGVGSSNRNVAGPRGDVGAGRTPTMAPPPVTSKASAFALLADDSSKPMAATSSGRPSKSPDKAELTKDQLERRIKSIRNDFMSNGGNVEELVLSMQELEGTPNFGAEVVQRNVDHSIECKESERVAIVKILSIVAEKKLVSVDDVKNGLSGVIEYIDSLVLDSPRVFEYMGELLACMLRIKVIDLDWICEQAEKTKYENPNTQAPTKIIRATIRSFKTLVGLPLTEETFVAASAKLATLLGDEGKWRSLSQEELN